MATHRSLPRTLQLLLVLGVLNFGAVAVTSIIRQPIDQTEIFSYGSSSSERVTLFCIVLSTDPRDSETVWNIEWYKNGVPISQNMHVLFDPFTYGNRARYTIHFANGGGYQETNLQIETSASNAEYDSGNYKCRVFLTTLESRTARLDVFVTPQSGSVLCSVGDDSQDDVFDVVSGNPITLVCRSDPTGVPQMTTDWKREGFEGDMLQTVTSTDPSGGWRIRSFYWTPTKAQHHATFICTGFHPGNRRNTTCQLGPFNVQYKPTAEISPSDHTVTMENPSVVFTCKDDGNPPVTRYVWSNTAGDKFNNQSNNVVVIGSRGRSILMRNFGPQDNGVYYVRCYAENDIGKSMYAEATLYVIIPSTRTTASSARTVPLLPTNDLISGSNQLPGEETLASEDAKSVTEPSTPAVSKQYGNTASNGQDDMALVVSTSTSTVDAIGKTARNTAKTSQVNTIVIIVVSVVADLF